MQDKDDLTAQTIKDLINTYNADVLANRVPEYYTAPQLTPMPAITYNDTQVYSTKLSSARHWTIPADNVYATRVVTPSLSKYDTTLLVTLEDGSIRSISREELVKYIGERDLIENNEIVRTMYDRFQVAVKLARSDDNGDAGV